MAERSRPSTRPPSEAGGHAAEEAPPARASFTEGLSFSMLSFGSIAVVTLATAVVTARVYGIEVMGEFALATAPMNLVWFLSTVREQPALVRELAPLPARHPRASGLALAVLMFSFGLTFVVTLVAVPLCWLAFNGPVDQPQLFWPAVVSLLGYLLIVNTCWNCDTVFSAYRAGRQLFWIRLHQAASYFCLAIAASFVIGTVWGPVLATIASWAGSLVHRVIRIRRWVRLRIPRHELRDGLRSLPEIIRFGLKVAPGTVADGVSAEAPTWILGVLSSVATVGAFNRASTLGRRMVELTWRVNEMMFPTLLERRRASDGAGFDRALLDTVRYVATAMLLPAAVVGGAAVPVMQVFGPGFSRAAGALALLLLAPVLITISEAVNTALMAADQPWRTSQISFVSLPATLAATWVLTDLAGLTGTACGVLVGYVVDAGLRVRAARPQLSARLRDLWSPRQALGLAVAYGSGFAVARLAVDAFGDVLGLLLALSVGGLAYAVVLLVVGGLNERDRRRIALVRARIAVRGHVAA